MWSPCPRLRRLRHCLKMQAWLYICEVLQSGTTAFTSEHSMQTIVVRVEQTAHASCLELPVQPAMEESGTSRCFLASVRGERR